MSHETEETIHSLTLINIDKIFLYTNLCWVHKCYFLLVHCTMNTKTGTESLDHEKILSRVSSHK